MLDYDITRALWPLKILQAPPTTDREYYAPITASIDAALALVGRQLPFAWVRLDHWPDNEIGAVASILPKPTPNTTRVVKTDVMILLWPQT